MTTDRQASMVEMRPLRVADERYDVVILGGGLAGLTLALQIKGRRPQTSVLVLEKREGPAPEAAFKVGESTVTIGAHYYAEVVGLRDHLDTRQLKKAGLRFLLPADGNEDITQRVEHGPRNFPAFDTYQVDRGRFENEIAVRVRAAGADLLDGCRVRSVDLSDDGDHTVTYTQFEREQSVRAHWIVDAAGRASIMKNKLGLARDIPHTINSAWFRLAGGLNFEQWGADDAEWMARMEEPGIRMHSTNHLMGEGYWVWLIPLSSGPISIGVCADPRVHPFDTFNEPERMREWLRRNEPQLAAAIDERVQDMEDFLRVADFAYGVERILSPQRWALVGEAGAFADPFFSPGSDFIAMSNTFACDVLTRELDGEDVGERVDYFNSYYQRAFEFTIAKYEDHYFTFGNPWVMNVKLGWEMVNLQVPPLIIINGRLDDLDFLKSIADDLESFYRLNLRMQQLFHDWRDLERREVGAAFGVGGPMKPLGVVLTCLVQQFDEDTLRTIMTNDLRMVEGMAVQIFHKAASALPSPPDPARPVDPYAVSLVPERWDADGLYDGERGLTLEQARELAPGVENLYLDAALAPS